MRYHFKFNKFNKFNKLKEHGFTLLEMLLVLTVISAIIMMIISYTTQKANELRQDRMVLQIQTLLNAASTYYVSMGKWPLSLEELKPNYISDIKNNPWGKPVLINAGTAMGPKWGLKTQIPSTVDRQIIAGRLPMASTSPTDDSLYADITIPGQNLNNARSVNFAAVYKNGACVPAPECPDGMVPQIFVIPVSVGGFNDSTDNVYPISSFTAYAYGAVNGTTPDPKPVLGGKGIASCSNPKAEEKAGPSGWGGGFENCQSSRDPGKIDPNTKYWRVCLQVVTQKGDTRGSNDAEIKKADVNWFWGQKVTVMAVTRCAPTNEPTGNAFGVFTK